MSPEVLNQASLIKSLFPDCLYGFMPDKHANFGRVLEAKEITQANLDKAATLQYGSFFTPNGHGNIKNPKGTLLRWDGNVTRFNACFADFDAGTKEQQLEIIKTFPLPYSLLIESKRGYHVYWMLKDSKNAPSADSSLWRSIQTTIATKYHADKACSNPSRLMRLPGSYHVKGDPYLVQIKEINNLTYTLAELELEFPPPPRKTYAYAQDRNAKKQIHMPPLTAIHDGDRHTTLKETAGRLYAHSDQSDASIIRDVLKCWYQRSCINLKSNWQREVDDVCDWVEAREYNSNFSNARPNIPLV